MKIFANHVYLGKTAEDYIKLIDLAIAEDTTQKSEARIRFAKKHTWENNIEAIEAAVKKSIKKAV